PRSGAQGGRGNGLRGGCMLGLTLVLAIAMIGLMAALDFARGEMRARRARRQLAKELRASLLRRAETLKVVAIDPVHRFDLAAIVGDLKRPGDHTLERLHAMGDEVTGIEAEVLPQEEAA
ncbi:MAG: hypothetical protein AAFU79_36420, partial [Myxococcota bacterium]